jgi:hypothetical protein
MFDHVKTPCELLGGIQIGGCPTLIPYLSKKQTERDQRCVSGIVITYRHHLVDFLCLVLAYHSA